MNTSRRQFFHSMSCFGASLLFPIEAFAKISNRLLSPQSSMELSPVKRKGKWGFIDTNTNKIIVDYQFDCARQFFSSLACVKVCGPNGDSQYGYINNSGEMAIPLFKCQFAGNFEEEVTIVSIAGRDGVIGKTGNFIVEPKFDYAGDFVNGIARVKINNKYGLLNKVGQFILPCEYRDISFFEKDGTASIELGEKIGRVNLLGEITWT
jgi:hypothetical protein